MKINNVLKVLIILIVLSTIVVTVTIQKKKDNIMEEKKPKQFNEMTVDSNKFTIAKDDDNNLNLIYNGKELEQFMTVVDVNDAVTIKIEAKNGDEIKDIYLIDKVNGEKIYFNNDYNEITLTTELVQDHDYGVTINGALVGGIRAVGDFNEVDLDIVKMDMFLNMKCGL